MTAAIGNDRKGPDVETAFTLFGLWCGLMFVLGMILFVYHTIRHMRRSLRIARAMNS